MSAPKDYLLLERPGAKEMIVFLSAMNVGGGCFNWISLAESLKSHCLLLSDARNRWYLDGVASMGDDFDSTARQIETLGARLAVNSMVFVGSSMGAYGALRLGSAVGASALAFSPEAVLDRPGSRSAKHRKGGAPVPAVGNNATIIFGESDPHDLWNAHYLADTGALVLGLHGVGHYASTALNQAGLLPDLLDTFLGQGHVSSVEKLRPIARLAGSWRPPPMVGTAVHDAACVRAITRAHEAFLARAWGALEVRARKAVGLYPISDYAHYLVGLALLNLKQPAAALSSFATATMLSNCSAEYHHSLGIAYWRLGHARLARDAQQQVLRNWPRHGKAQYALAMIDLSEGDTQTARARLEQALEWEPNHPSWRKKLSQITP